VVLNLYTVFIDVIPAYVLLRRLIFV